MDYPLEPGFPRAGRAGRDPRQMRGLSHLHRLHIGAMVPTAPLSLAHFGDVIELFQRLLHFRLPTALAISLYFLWPAPPQHADQQIGAPQPFQRTTQYAVR